MNNNKLKGVNLGGWLVLEKWMTPSVFAGTNANDEYSLCIELGEAKHETLEKHRRGFITAEDFKWIAESGLNAVRIPVGYWVSGDAEPYVGCIEFLDWAMHQAQEYDLRVLIDLHGAPGSQNGWDHSGRSGVLDWYGNPDNIARSLQTIELLAKRYKSHPALWGIELLNEPRADIPLGVLTEYYRQGYDIVRKHCGDRVAVVVSDSFRMKEMRYEVGKLDLRNCVLDCHMYQIFSESDRALSYSGHIEKALLDWSYDIEDVQKSIPVIVGEWSAVLSHVTYEGFTATQQYQAQVAYAAAQQLSFDDACGWFYWNLKTESGGLWSLQDAHKRGIVRPKQGR